MAVREELFPSVISAVGIVSILVIIFNNQPECLLKRAQLHMVDFNKVSNLYHVDRPIVFNHRFTN